MAQNKPLIETPPADGWLAQGIDRIVGLGKAESRAPIVKLEDDLSERAWLFDDAAGKYVELDRFPAHNLIVSSGASFGDLIANELTLRGNTTGRGARVIVNRTGGIFFPVYLDPRHSHTYARKESEAFRALSKLIGAGLLEMVPFVRALQGLKTYLAYADATIRSIRKVQALESTSIDAAPFVEEGEAGYQYRVTLNVRGGKAETALPAEVTFRDVPWCAGGDGHRFDLETEVDIALVDQGGKKVLKFGLCCPTWNAQVEHLLESDAAGIRSDLRGASDIVVVEAF